MDSFLGSSSATVDVMLHELLAAEKDATRVWLRAEIDRLLDPILDSIFDRLTSKLVGNEHWDGTCQPSTFTTFNPISSHFKQQFVNINTNYHKQHSNGPFHFNSIHPNAQLSNQSQPMTIKEEIETNSNELMMPAGQQVQSFSYQKSSHNFTNLKKENHINLNYHQQQMVNPLDHTESNNSNSIVGYEPESDPEILAQVKREIKEERNEMNVKRMMDNGEQNQQFENEYEEDMEEGDDDYVQKVTFRSVKRLRSSRPTTLNDKNHEKQIITHSLRCPQCGLMFAKDKLNKHLKEQHSIGPFRCVVKDCSESFDIKHNLDQHLVQFHQSTSQWHCDNCDHHFTSYALLSKHSHQQHQLGHFQCSYPSCTFTGEYRKKVANHYAQQHKTRILNKCQHFGCHYETLKASDLKRHKRTHLDIKPYKCKWSQCDYSSVEKFKAINHIRKSHFLHPIPGSVQNGEQLDPNDYLEVRHGLL